MQDLIKLIKEQLTSNNLEHLGAILDSQTDRTKTLNIIDLMIKRGFIELDQEIKIYLFKTLYFSGYYCYVAVDCASFKDNWDHVKPDLDIIASDVNCKTLESINYEMQVTLNEMYLIEEPPELVDLLD